MNYRYGSHIFSDQELPYTLAINFDDLIFDEFHIFSIPQIVAALTAMLFFLEYLGSEAPRFLFSSATPDALFLQMMKRAGIRVQEIHGTYSTRGEEHWRHILHQASLALHQLGEDENTEDWLQKNLHIIINHWRRTGRPLKGAIILNSVVTSRRVSKLLKEQLQAYGIKVGEVSGMVNNQQRREAMEKADLVVGTSTIDIGIDFNISLLMFETLDAGSFLQRLGRLGRVRQGEEPFDRYEAHALFSKRTPWIYERFVRRLHEQGIHDGDAIERPTTLRSIVTEQEVFPRSTAFKAYAKRWGILQAVHVLATLEGRSREQSFLSLAQALRKRYQALFDLRDFTYACGRYKHLLCSTHSQEQGPGRYVLDEVLSFRGSSPFQAAVWDDSTAPANFIGYDALALVHNSDYRVIKEATYRAALEELSSSVQEEALEELYWSLKDKDGQALVLKILRFLQERESLVLGWERYSLRDLTRQIIVLNGCHVVAPCTSPDIDRLNQFLRRQMLVCYFTKKEMSELRRDLKLPPYFPLYRVEQSGKLYTAAFGKTALLLEAEMLRFRGRDEETEEAIFC